MTTAFNENMLFTFYSDNILENCYKLHNNGNRNTSEVTEQVTEYLEFKIRDKRVKKQRVPVSFFVQPNPVIFSLQWYSVYNDKSSHDDKLEAKDASYYFYKFCLENNSSIIKTVKDIISTMPALKSFKKNENKNVCNVFFSCPHKLFLSMFKLRNLRNWENCSIGCLSMKRTTPKIPRYWTCFSFLWLRGLQQQKYHFLYTVFKLSSSV